MKVDPRLSVAEIARRHPKALPVLAKYRIDLCCGGAHALAFVAEKRGLDLGAILREIEEALRPKEPAPP